MKYFSNLNHIFFFVNGCTPNGVAQIFKKAILQKIYALDTYLISQTALKARLINSCDERCRAFLLVLQTVITQNFT